MLRNSLKLKKPPACASEELLDALAETVVDARSDATDLYLAALRRCKEKLSALDEQLLDLRYVEDLSTRQIADQTGRPQQGVCNSLLRIRRRSFDCIQMELAQKKHSARGDHA